MCELFSRHISITICLSCVNVIFFCCFSCSWNGVLVVHVSILNRSFVNSDKNNCHFNSYAGNVKLKVVDKFCFPFCVILDFFFSSLICHLLLLLNTKHAVMLCWSVVFTLSRIRIGFKHEFFVLHFTRFRVFSSLFWSSTLRARVIIFQKKN